MSIDMLVYEQKEKQIRIAGLENGCLVEADVFTDGGVCEGDIFLGRITHKIELANGNVGYFVNIGDIKEAFVNAREVGLRDLEAAEGQDLVVQVCQAQRAEKGAKLCRALQFVGENLVYCPYRMDIEVSSKIEDKERAEALRKLVLEHTEGQEGWIIRTAAETCDAETLIEEMGVLRQKYEQVRVRARKAKAPERLCEKANPLYDFIAKNNTSLEKIVVNTRQFYEELGAKYGSDYEVELDKKPFDKYGVEEALLEALQPEIKLKSGGRIFIEETKACVAIDVDSGGGNTHVSHLNSEAAEEILKQIRLRNLSGKIVIDFAGSSEYRFLKSVIEQLEEGLKRDKVRATCFGLSRAGNVEIVRMRRRPSLRDLLTDVCATCQGTGRVEK